MVFVVIVVGFLFKRFSRSSGDLRVILLCSEFLVPGFGAQGGTAESVRSAFDDRGLGAIINSSRAIIFAHARPEYESLAEKSWLAAVEQATRDMVEQLAV